MTSLIIWTIVATITFWLTVENTFLLVGKFVLLGSKQIGRISGDVIRGVALVWALLFVEFAVLFLFIL